MTARATDDDSDAVLVSVGGVTHELSPAAATALRTALGEAVADRRVFVHTVGERRPDGSYVVHRRGAESTGNSVVFDSFGALRRLYDRLRPTVDAAAVGEEGITGSRRHLVVRHLAEHPAFDCRIDSRSPLRARSRATTREVPADADADRDPDPGTDEPRTETARDD